MEPSITQARSGRWVLSRPGRKDKAFAAHQEAHAWLHRHSAPAIEPVPEVPAVDLAPVLALSIPALGRRLAEGDLDDCLEALEAAEAAGPARKGALSAIRARRGA